METINYRGYIIEIGRDEFPPSPREWDNFGTFCLFHNRYTPPNESWIRESDFENGEEFLELVKKESEGGIYLTVYMLDHSEVWFSTTSFNDRWDSGQVGYIYVSGDRIKSEYKELTPESLKIAEKVLKNEVERYGKYANGEVYYFTVRSKVDDVESGYDYYDYETCLQDAKSCVDAEIRRIEKKNQAKLKEYIKNHVPLEKRLY